MAEYVRIPLDIEGVKVDHVEVTKVGEFHIHVSSTVEGTTCHRCGREIRDGYGYGREIKLRHLPILDRPTYLLMKPRRYICRRCTGNPVTTQTLPWYEPRHAATKAYEEHILKSLVNSTLYDVSRKARIGMDEVEDIVARQFGKGMDWKTLDALPTLGIDDLALKKGHRDFATIITVRLEEGKNRVLGVLEDREKATVKAFFMSIPKHLRDTVKEVCSDLYEGYTEAAREVFGGNVTIIADRFHVAKLYRGVVDQTRKAEQRRLKNELSEVDYGKLKGALWLVRKRPEDLNEKERVTLNLLLAQSPVLLSVYLLAGALTGIFDEPHSKTEAEELIRAWMRLVEEVAAPGFERFLKTLDEKMDVITNYFVRRHNSGFVEGINHKIRVLMGRCYGLFNRVHLFQRLALDLGEYAQFS
jgi:transposase